MNEKQNHFLKVYKKVLFSLGYPQVILCLLAPVFLALLFWVTMTILFWDKMFLVLGSSVKEMILYVMRTIAFIPPSIISYLADSSSVISIILLWTLVILLIIPVVLVSAAIITSVLAGTYLIQFLGRKEFPDLTKKGRALIGASLLNAILYSCIYLVLWLISLPLMLFPPLTPFISVILVAWYNLKLGSFDVLTEWCDEQEFKVLRRQSQSKAFIVSLIGSSSILMPFAFLFAPVIVNMALTFHYMYQLRSYREKLT